MATFDGINLIITLPSHGGAGVSTIDSEADLYSDWKEWLLGDPQRQGFPPAFRTIGGDSLPGGTDAGSYFFIRNDLGWRIRPAEEDGNYFFIGNLVPQIDTLPIVVPTLGGYTVLINGIQPITQVVETNTGGGGDSVWTEVEKDKVIADSEAAKTQSELAALNTQKSI